MGDVGVGRGWVKTGAVRLAGADGFSHGVVDFQNDALGAAEAGETLAFAL